jgi:Uma2 family endonuclease
MNMVTPFDAAPVPLRFDIGRFMAMAREGMFADFAKAELIEGEIFVVNAQFRRHAWARKQLVCAFDAALSGRNDGLAVVDECSVALSDETMPEPDIVLTTEPKGDGPVPAHSIKLIVEISDTTLASDLGRKVALYAGHNVSEYWVVDLESGRIHQLWSPVGNDYSERESLGIGEAIALRTLPEISVATTAIL